MQSNDAMIMTLNLINSFHHIRYTTFINIQFGLSFSHLFFFFLFCFILSVQMYTNDKCLQCFPFFL